MPTYSYKNDYRQNQSVGLAAQELSLLVSETSWLKVVDPLFKTAGGGSAIPIKIVGTRDQPSFGLDKRRVFKRSK